MVGEGNGSPLQCSCLENSRDWGAWRAAVCGVAQSWTRLKQLSSSRSSGSGVKNLPADAGDAGGRGSFPGSGRPPGVMMPADAGDAGGRGSVPGSGRPPGVMMPADAGDEGGRGSVPGSGRPPGVMTTHSSILTWEIPWTEEPGGLQFMGLKEWDTTG